VTSCLLNQAPCVARLVHRLRGGEGLLFESAKIVAVSNNTSRRPTRCSSVTSLSHNEPLVVGRKCDNDYGIINEDAGVPYGPNVNRMK